MRKRKLFGLGSLTVAAMIAAQGIASASVSNQTFDAVVTPTKLAKKGTPTPISLTITTSASFSSPSTDPAPTLVDLDLDNDIKINTKGLKTCDQAALLNTTTAQAESTCGVAKVGSGSVKLDGLVGPQNGIVTAFLGGPALLLLHVRVEGLSLTQVLEGVVSTSPVGGDFGSRVEIVVPAQQLAGGHEVLTDFNVTVSKPFTLKRKTKGKPTKVKSGLLTSSCKDKDRTLNFQGSAGFTQFAATGIPAGPGPSFLLSDTVGCTPKKVKPKK
ncbi:MAG: hypothetical protein ACXWW8_00450 [Solirubrobacterales bacterium]